MTDDPDLRTVGELEHLYSSLSVDDRDQLLQEMLVAAARGGEAMMRVLEVWLVDVAGQELLASLDGPE